MVATTNVCSVRLLLQRLLVEQTHLEFGPSGGPFADFYERRESCSVLKPNNLILSYHTIEIEIR